MKESQQQRAKTLLKPYRAKIDTLDRQILELLGKRFALVRKAAAIKARYGLPAHSKDRIEEVMYNAVKGGKKHGIDPLFMYGLYSQVVHYCCVMEEAVRAKVKK